MKGGTSFGIYGMARTVTWAQHDKDLVAIIVIVAEIARVERNELEHRCDKVGKEERVESEWDDGVNLQY